MNLPIETQYNILVQVDYLTGLCVAYMLGACRWSLFVILLVASLLLGFVTVRVYTKMMKEIINRR